MKPEDVVEKNGVSDYSRSFCGRSKHLALIYTPNSNQDLSDALEGASVTEMTWDAGGTDAVIGAAGGDGGGGIWHIRLPTLSASPPHNGVAETEPTVARLWPGGIVKA